MSSEAAKAYMQRRPYDAKEYHEIMAYEGLGESQAVKTQLKRAAKFMRFYKGVSDGCSQAGLDNDFVQKQLADVEEQRCEAVFDAIESARQEKRQRWRFIEDGEKFISYLLIKYKGDLTKCNPLEKRQVDMAEVSEQVSRAQVKEAATSQHITQQAQQHALQRKKRQAS